ncbi:MAG: L-glutamate gamma-semialdehyde dehydrogenase [Myxococcota bacterium]
MNAIFNLPTPVNEPVLNYKPGSKERKLVEQELQRQLDEDLEIPLIIGGETVNTGNTGKIVCPHDHRKVLATYHKAGEKEVKMAIDAALEAKEKWAQMHWSDRAAIFLKAAELITTKYRYILNAATMLNQSKSIHQAEIDATAELADFFRFNAHFLQEIYKDQPMYNAPGTWNRLEFRPLEGFVFAVTPFNFVSIAGNLPTAPALTGNVVLWKPASSVVYSNYYLMLLFKEAGLPDGVINFVPGSGAQVGNPVLDNENLAGIHFTGSTGTFNYMWKKIGNNIAKYRTFPRIVGETGGKDFIFVHKSASTTEVAVAAVRGAFEYQGQKCSAASRMYVPKSSWGEIKDKILTMAKDIKMGAPLDFKNFMNAVIDENAFDSITEYIDYAAKADKAKIICGGKYDKSKGYYIDPTVIVTTDPHFKTIEEEIFGPVLTVYVYKDNEYEETLELCDSTSPYGLTGAIFARDRSAVQTAYAALRNSAGNFYINDKPTGAVVGQQPFGGARGSGTNDKAGSALNLQKWISHRTVKETFCPARDYKYPFMK